MININKKRNLRSFQIFLDEVLYYIYRTLMKGKSFMDRKLDSVDLDLLKTIRDDKTFKNILTPQVEDLNGENARGRLLDLRQRGYIETEPSNLGIGEEKIIGLTPKGENILKR